MAYPSREGRGFWLGFGLLVLVGAFLGLRSGRAVTAVLGAKKQTTAGAYLVKESRSADAVLAARRDSLLAEAFPSNRDPFRDPSAAPTGSSPAATSTRESEDVPALRALLFDNVNPSVQISVGGVTSDWLHRGEKFQGWTVTEIEARSVRVTRGARSVVLPAS